MRTAPPPRSVRSEFPHIGSHLGYVTANLPPQPAPPRERSSPVTRMYGPAVRGKRFHRCVGIAVLRQCIRPLLGALLLAIMDISAHAVSLADRPRTGHQGHQGSHAPEDRTSISSYPLADLGGKAGLRHRRLLISAVPLFVPLAVPSSRPAHLRAPRTGAVKAGRRRRPPALLGLDGPEHGATLRQGGTRSQWCIRSCALC